jgi:ABC-2 type transport system permease protein
VGRYVSLFLIQFRASALIRLQYRLDFVVEAVMGIFWSAAAAVPLLVLFSQRQSVAGWTWPEALTVLGCFLILRGIIDGAIQPALRHVVEHIRVGTLDFLIIKPVDAQFMAMTSQFEVWRTSDSVGGLIVLGWSIHELGRWPTLGGALLAVVLLAAAVVTLYSTWILVVSLAFFVGKVDDLSYLFSSIYDLARWPASIFRGSLALIFTFVVPLGVMTTFPALALLGRLELWQGAVALLAAAGWCAVARCVWLYSVRHYTGAGG